jgi:hypothetical protein
MRTSIGVGNGGNLKLNVEIFYDTGVAILFESDCEVGSSRCDKDGRASEAKCSWSVARVEAMSILL